MSDKFDTTADAATNRPDEGVHNGIPKEATEVDANALPHSHRQSSETAGTPAGGDDESPKHDHNPDK